MSMMTYVAARVRKCQSPVTETRPFAACEMRKWKDGEFEVYGEEYGCSKKSQDPVNAWHAPLA